MTNIDFLPFLKTPTRYFEFKNSEYYALIAVVKSYVINEEGTIIGEPIEQKARNIYFHIIYGGNEEFTDFVETNPKEISEAEAFKLFSEGVSVEGITVNDALYDFYGYKDDVLLIDSSLL